MERACDFMFLSHKFIRGHPEASAPPFPLPVTLLLTLNQKRIVSPKSSL